MKDTHSHTHTTWCVKIIVSRIEQYKKQNKQNRICVSYMALQEQWEQNEEEEEEQQQAEYVIE